MRMSINSLSIFACLLYFLNFRFLGLNYGVESLSRELCYLRARGLLAEMAGRTALTGEGLLLNATLLFGELVHNCNEDTVNKEAAGCLSEHGDLDCLKESDLEACEGACAENLSYGSHKNESEEEAYAHTDTVECGIDNAVLSREHFCSAENDTVNNDKCKIYAEHIVDSREVCVEKHLYCSNECRDDYDIARNSNGVGNNLAECGDNHVRADENYGSRKSHGERGDHGGSCRESGTSTEDKNENGVLHNDTAKEYH